MGYRDLSRLTRVLHICLAIVALVSLASAWSSWMEFDLFRRVGGGGSVTQDELLASDRRQGIMGAAWLLAFPVASVAFLQWTYWGTRNAHALGMSRPTFSPAWAVGWYFVPIANLWKPYQALRDAFQGSHPEHQRWRFAPRPWFMPVWWALWLISTTAGNASFRVWMRTDTLDGAILSSGLDVFSSLVDVPLAAVVFLLSRDLLSMQTAKHVALSEAGVEHDVALPTSSPRKTLLTLSAVAGSSAAAVLVGGLLLAFAAPAPVDDRAATGLSDPGVASGIGTITAFIREEWTGQGPPQTLAEVQERWWGLGRGDFPFDPFDGLDYGYEQDGVAFRLWSSGADGVAGTADDQVQEWVVP